jgi:glycosyltransferase involved in cell wall biosynthesis
VANAERSPAPESAEAIAARLRDPLDALVVCVSHSWGGLEQVAMQDAVECGALGLRVRVLCLEGTPAHARLAGRPEVSVVPLGFRPRDFADWKLRQALHRLVDGGVNLIHAHQTSLLGSLVPALWGRPRVALLASRHIMNGHDKRNFFHRAIYRRLDAMIVMSETLRRNVLATHPLRERQVKVVNLGLDFGRFDPARADGRTHRAAWGADEGTTVIGLVGRIDPAKGQDTFIKAAAGLLKGGPAEKLKFVLVGEETKGAESGHLDSLKEMVRQFRLENHVVFGGYQENIPEVMKAFDVLVMPSRQEAFGLVAIEAMAMETPIVISSGGSAEEIVGGGDGAAPAFGLLVRPGDAFDLQRRLRQLIDQPEERREMGRRAREHVLAHYDRRVRLARTLGLYERALYRRSLA